MSTGERFEANGELTDLINRRDDLSPEELAAVVKEWRRGARVENAALMLGISVRTLEGITQGRGFRYPRLLLLAMRDLKPHGRWRY